LKKENSKFIAIISLIILFFSINLFGQLNTKKLMEQAGNLYKAKKYEKAEKVYSKLVNSGYQGASLFYNLANTFYRENKLGYAILYYNKALNLSPGDEDVKYNLDISKSRMIDKIDTLPKFFLFQWWESILALFNLSGWTYLTYLFFILLLICIALYFLVKKQKIQRTSFYTGIVMLFFLILTGIFTGIKLNRRLNVRNAIVITNVVTVKLSPDEKSNDAFVIHEGLKVKLEDKVDNWVKIRLHDGKVGWITKNNVGII